MDIRESKLSNKEFDYNQILQIIFKEFENERKTNEGPIKI